MKKKLLIAAALLGVSVVSSTVSSAPLRYCDTACPTSDGFCNCPLWTDKPKAPSFCYGWNTVGGCWYE
ncbi:MAG TPA: hypothetical protein VLQ45_28815 [Thermoanaerobaculia bacterium]|nr:hypothetical protein [Thermoanaerobaculia bacterium]HSN87408.1 hypothetical protein [Thermoanaerobaculia bacterium]